MLIGVVHSPNNAIFFVTVFPLRHIMYCETETPQGSGNSQSIH